VKFHIEPVIFRIIEKLFGYHRQDKSAPNIKNSKDTRFQRNLQLLRLLDSAAVPAEATWAGSGCYNENMVATDWQRIMEELCGLEVSRVVLMGVSGGPDSLTLLDVLIRAGCRVETAHLNHHLREEAEADARVAQAAADQYQVRHHYGEAQVSRLAREEKLTIEEAARKARYRFLFQTARRIGAQAVAVGHTADDQIETILMHLLRGSGLAGLRGMPWRGLLPEFDARIPIVRPLLEMWREEILAYCRERSLRPVSDASNYDTTFYRNRLRHALIPVLQQYNPRVKELLWRSGQTLQGDYDIVEGVVREAEKNILLESAQGYEKFERERFLGQVVGVRRSLMRRMIARLRADERDIDFGMVERALAFTARPARSGEMELALGLSLFVLGNTILLKETALELVDGDWPRLMDDELGITIPGRAALADGWELTAEIIDGNELDDAALKTQDEMTTWLDAEKISGSLTIRRHNPGDRMRPYGFEGHSIKISDIWVNIKLPRLARKNWPLVCSGDTIAWLPGYRPGADFIVTEETRRVVKLTLKRT
jgi:tRNA(Ile)-lysidine synthase